MPFPGQQKSQMQIRQAEVLSGIWNNPITMGDGVVGDPATLFTSGGSLGYIQNGSFKNSILREFAEVLSGNPKKLVRKDLTRKQMIIEAMLQQFNAETMNLATNSFTEADYVNVAADFLGDLILHGTEEESCGDVFNGYMIIGQLVDCTPFGIGVYAGIQTAEDVSLEYGDTHVVMPVKIEATPHPDFPDTQDGQKRSLGLWWLNRT